MSIEVKDLLKVYGDQKAVNNISFSVKKGEITGFLGPNGAGKSTTMKIITGSLQQNGGQAFVCGFNISETPLEIKRRTGYLPEQNALYYDMYVKEYLGFIATLHKISNAKNKIAEVIETVGLTAEAKKKIGQLSKGYKQRVGLAAALVHEPEVLILDEPTSGLDPNQIVEIRNVIRQQGKDKTVLFSSHILQEVEAICDRVIIINKGVIVADDTLDQLRSHSTGKQTVKVEFSNPVNEDWLKELNGVEKINNIQSRTFNIQCGNAEAVKKQILQLAIDKNLNIISLQSGNQRLEEIFRELTQ
jgi:ABC-2 type transport system ATP-binding protein